MKAFNYLLLLTALFCALKSNGQSATEKKEVPSVKIGTQEWTAENLNVSTFRNGDTIAEIKNQKDWEAASRSKKPAWCYYKNNAKNGSKYGKLYNFWAVSDPRGLAPEGWHVATGKEWIILIQFLGGNFEAGAALKSCAPGATEGFVAQLGGMRGAYDTFDDIGERAYYWTATQKDDSYAYMWMISNSNSVVFSYDWGKGAGLSVRCVKD